jgi:tetratricopeptide (TPR) repeat protein
MDEPQTDPTNRRGLRRGMLALVALAAVLTVGGPIGGYWYWTARNARIEAEREAVQTARANEAIAPVLDAFGRAEGAYDIDETIRVMHELDRAIEERSSLEAYLQEIATRDYRRVAPEVLEARTELLEILMQLYGKQVEVEDQQALWEVSAEVLLATASVVAVSGDAGATGPSGGFSVDREQAQQLLREMRDERARHRELVRDMAGLETDLVRAMVEYSEVYYKYVDEWDELSVLRDRAYLAAHNQDWRTAYESATLAIQKSPREREAHLLAAMALIEMNDPEKDAEVVRLLDEYMADHPGSTAPAFQLMGALHARRGRIDEARLAFQQSAAYYPRQADELTDMADPYRMRSFLRESREGSFIIELYKSTMLGAGYFSPDLQLAQILFEQGDVEGGKAKVLDHFSRRRNQQQWDFVLSDIEFCYELLGPVFWEIFPEDSYLDLEVSKTLLGSQLNVSVDNRSDRTLRNATLLLAVQFTDMFATDYEVLAAPRTLPAVNARETTSFGTIDVNVEMFGVTKTVDDVVRHRAILITNEAVLWVDTDEYKIELAAERTAATQPGAVGNRAAPEPVVPAERFPEYQTTVDGVVGAISDAVSVEVEQRYGADNVLIKLPKSLSILRPIFRLRYGDQVLAVDDNVIDGDHIELRFKGVENFDAEGVDPNDLELLVASPFGDLVVSWVNDGTVSWRYAGVERR